jgi:hypothetical protein
MSQKGGSSLPKARREERKRDRRELKRLGVTSGSVGRAASPSVSGDRLRSARTSRRAPLSPAPPAPEQVAEGSRALRLGMDVRNAFIRDHSRCQWPGCGARADEVDPSSLWAWIRRAGSM